MKTNHLFKKAKVTIYILLFSIGSNSCIQEKATEVVAPEGESVALALAQKIKEQLKDGADFHELARKFSDDPGSASLGGELGYFELGQLVPEYEKAALALKPGELSDPIRTKFGYHIIQLLDQKGDEFNTRHILIKP